VPSTGESTHQQVHRRTNPQQPLLGNPIARDLCVARTKALQTALDVRTSAEPQLAWTSCAKGRKTNRAR